MPGAKTMYDLETLRRLNEQACLTAVALASSDKPPSVQAEEKTKDVGPVEVIYIMKWTLCPFIRHLPG